MMWYSPLWAMLGLILVVVAVYDFYLTTVTVSGGGPISKSVARGTWRLLLAMHRKRPSHSMLKAGGPLILLMLILLWFAMCWFGWFLVFCGDDTAVVSVSTGLNASVWERAYYAGYTLTTVGYGNFQAPNPWGQFGSVMAGLNGLFLVTLAVTYSIPVVSAAVEKRQLALSIHAMGTSTPEMIDSGQGGGSFAPLVAQAQQLSSNIATLAEKHHAYPLLHYFHGSTDRTSLPLNLVRLSDTLSIVLFAYDDLPADARSQLSTSKRLLDSFLAVLEKSFLSPASEVPASPDYESSQAFARASRSAREVETYLKEASQRKLLLAYVRDDGWSWSDVVSAQ